MKKNFFFTCLFLLTTVINSYSNNISIINESKIEFKSFESKHLDIFEKNLDSELVPNGFFIDGKNIFIYGYILSKFGVIRGFIIKSSDSGKTFDDLTPGAIMEAYSIDALFFVNIKEGYIAAQWGFESPGEIKILKTSDCGTTWLEIKKIPKSFFDCPTISNLVANKDMLLLNLSDEICKTTDQTSYQLFIYDMKKMNWVEHTDIKEKKLFSYTPFNNTRLVNVQIDENKRLISIKNIENGQIYTIKLDYTAKLKGNKVYLK